MKEVQTHKTALIAVLLAAFLGGGIPVFSKIGLHIIPPFTFTFLRFCIASLVLAPFVLKQLHTYKKELWRTVPLSLLATANVTFFAFGVKLTTATISQLLYCVVPIISAFLSYFILKETITLKKLFGIILGSLGVGIIIILPVISKGSSLNGNFVGNTLVMTAVFVFSLYTVFSKKIQNKLSIPPLLLTFVFTLTTTIILSFFAAREYFINPNWIHQLSSSTAYSVLYVGLFGGAAYYMLYQFAIKNGTPLIASTTLFIQPIATYLWAFGLMNERLTIGIVIGGVCTLFGAYLVTFK